MKTPEHVYAPYCARCRDEAGKDRAKVPDDDLCAWHTTDALTTLRAENERLRKALRASARELQYIADDDPCDKLHQTAEGRACVALAEKLLGPMYLWADEPNLSAPAEEEGRDAS